MLVKDSSDLCGGHDFNGSPTVKEFESWPFNVLTGYPKKINICSNYFLPRHCYVTAYQPFAQDQSIVSVLSPILNLILV